MSTYPQRVRADHPRETLHGYVIRDSSNIRYVAWSLKDRCIVIWFKSGDVYRYDNAPYQRAVAAVRAPSVGRYVRNKIIPNFKAVKIA